MTNKQSKSDRARRKAADEYHRTRLLMKSAIRDRTATRAVVAVTPAESENSAQVKTQADQVTGRLSGRPKDTCSVRVKNRCVISGRARSVMRKYRMSRFGIRDYALNGMLPGVKKASW